MPQALLHSKLSDREAELEAQRRDMALSFDSASRQVVRLAPPMADRHQCQR
jgi:hypothetical protein